MPATQTIAIGGWYVSNSGTNPQKYQISLGDDAGAGAVFCN